MPPEADHDDFEYIPDPVLERQICASIAFASGFPPEVLDELERKGYDWLFDAANVMHALAGALSIRIARVERLLVEHGVEVPPL